MKLMKSAMMINIYKHQRYVMAESQTAMKTFGNKEGKAIIKMHKQSLC